MLLGAAQLLKAREASLPGRVRLMFQSAEEILAGATDMIANGALENPRPGGGMMIHVLTALEIPAGTVLFPPEGVIAPGAGCFSVDIFGRGCHGSTPEKGISPVRAAANIALALESLVSAEVGLDHPAVVSIGSMQAGEEAANVIPDRARLMGSLRAFDGETLAFLEKRIGEIARGMAEAERCRAEVKLFSQCPPMTNDRVLTDLAREAVDSLGLARQDVPLGGGGSEDFAYVAREIPALLLPLAAGEPSRGFVHPAHHPLTDFDGAVLPMGAKILAWVAEEWLKGA
jgi:hippurate hydrolase